MKSILKKFFYLKLCVLRAQGHYSFLMTIVSQFVSIMILLKVYGHAPVKIMVVVFFVVVVLSAILGHLDMKYGVYKMETSLQNAHNPEFLEMHRKIMEDKE